MGPWQGCAFFFLIFRTEDVLLLFVSQVVEVQNHETLTRECELKAGKKGKSDRARNLVCGCMWHQCMSLKQRKSFQSFHL